MRRIHVFVSGRVQGVYFRAHTQETAVHLRLAGWVRNLPDGRVEAVFEGADEDVLAALAWCRKGPPRAFVEDVTATDEPCTGSTDGFRILAGPILP